jgi:DNA-binding MarR family transcriptional regulator
MKPIPEAARGGLMIETAEEVQSRKTARELLRFLEEMMRTIARVDLGEPGASQLTLLEMRILIALGEAGEALRIRDIASLTAASAGETGQAAERLRVIGLSERAGGGRGEERAFAITGRGRRLLGSLDSSRQAAVERFIARLGRRERLRLEGAAHLLGRDLDRLSEGMFPA